ncbi:MAG TPA: polymer-forming cytoskeletal protein [Xanthobacteraceae bacterium]|jgi:cytoskeletal protein CcmA (bactofilin family)
MAVAEGTETTPRTCEPNVVYIGEGVTFKGELSAPELVVIDGAVEGEVRARCARVGATGSLKGSVIVTDADIQGSVSDRLEVKQLLIVRSTGHVEAEISYGELQIEKGAIISGALTSTDLRSANSDQPQNKAKRTGPPTLELKRGSTTNNTPMA